MFLSAYHLDGDPSELATAYDRFIAQVPAGDLSLNLCVVREGGITILDACPSYEVFRAFSSGPELADLLAVSGLPAPRLEPLGEVHRIAAPTG